MTTLHRMNYITRVEIRNTIPETCIRQMQGHVKRELRSKYTIIPIVKLMINQNTFNIQFVK